MAAKKSFTGAINPAELFISRPDTAQPETHARKAPEGLKANPMFVETKSKRVNLLMQPSLFEQVKAAAQAEGMSVNEYIHRTLEAAMKEREA